VPVEVPPIEDAGVAWEIHNAGGDVLRVRSSIAAGDLASVLAVMLGRESRP